MKNQFFELSVFSSQNKILREFAFELGITCVEEVANGFIIREEDDLSIIEFALREFAERVNIDIKTKITKKDNINWIEKYKSSVEPIKVGKFYIRPSWREKSSGIDIIVDPALAFGSGHHESTNSCLELISEFAPLLPMNSNALDVGCGSGILSIALKKLGFLVHSCDTDDQAVQATKQNAKKNSVKIDKIWVGSVKAGCKYDFVVANIIADVILILVAELKASVAPNGYLLLSGILNKYKERIRNAFSEFTLIKNLSKGEWESFIFKNEVENGK